MFKLTTTGDSVYPVATRTYWS